jgi:hypothetical protein
MEINNLLNSDPIEPALLEAWKASPLLVPVFVIATLVSFLQIRLALLRRFN